MSEQVHAELADGAAVFRAAFMAAARPPPPQTVSEWADQYRVLTRVASNEDGQWRTSRTPYLREPMDDMTAGSGTQIVVLMFATQVGKSEALLNVCGYIMHRQPGPVLIVQPTLKMAKRFSRQRLQPMIDASPALRDLVAAPKSRDSGNTISEKDFPGGVVNIVGANSPTDLRMLPVRYALLDEEAEYPPDLDDQGSVSDLVDRRQSSYGRSRKRLHASSPTLAECCPIEAQWLRSTMCEPHVPCVHCGAWGEVTLEQLTDDGERLCPECGQLASEAACKGVWYGREPAFRWVPTYPERAVRGYRLPSWFSALGLGYTWVEIAQMRERAAKDPIAAKTFANTICAVTYRDDSHRLDPKALAERREEWRMREPPPGCLLVTCGIDVQANRFAVALWGWGRGETAWWLDYVELPGNPVVREDWRVIDDYLARPLRNAFGRALPIEIVAVDSGNWTNEVYSFVRERQQNGFIAVKGLSTGRKPIIAARPSFQDLTQSGHTIKRGVALWTVGTDSGKATLLGRLMSDDQAEPAERLVRLPADIPDEALDQLTAERWDQETRRFRRVVGKRNEGLDCFVYAYAAAHHPVVRVHTLREPDWSRLEAEREPRVDDMFDPPPPPPARADAGASGGGFIKGPRGAGPFIKRG